MTIHEDDDPIFMNMKENSCHVHDGAQEDGSVYGKWEDIEDSSV